MSTLDEVGTSKVIEYKGIFCDWPNDDDDYVDVETKVQITADTPKLRRRARIALIKTHLALIKDLRD